MSFCAPYWSAQAPRCGQTWADLRKAFFGSLGACTRHAYEQSLAQFDTACALTPEAVRMRDVQRWRDELYAAGRSPATVRARVAAVASWYRWLTRYPDQQGDPLLTHNPAAGTKCQTVPMYGRSRKIALPLYRSIMGVIKDTPIGRQDRSLIAGYVLTGRRRSELERVRWADLTQAEDGKWYYRYTGKRGKSGRREMPPEVMELLFAWTAPGAPDDLVWPAGSNGLARRLKKYAGEAREQVHIHGFRHLHAALLKRAGASIEEIRASLDHSSVAITAVYLERLETPSDQYADMMSALLRGEEITPKKRRRKAL